MFYKVRMHSVTTGVRPKFAFCSMSLYRVSPSLRRLLADSIRLRTRVKREHLDKADGRCCLKREEAGVEEPRPAKRRRISQKSPDVSDRSFEARLPDWGQKCLAFQSSGKARLPTQPCCPASMFLGLAENPWQGSDVNATEASSMPSLSTSSSSAARGTACPSHLSSRHPALSYGIAVETLCTTFGTVVKAHEHTDPLPGPSFVQRALLYK